MNSLKQWVANSSEAVNIRLGKIANTHTHTCTPVIHPQIFDYSYDSHHRPKDVSAFSAPQTHPSYSPVYTIIVKAVPGSGDDDDEDDIIEFNPEFTYPIFGEQEQIFGYKDLMINVREAANI